MLCVEPVVVYSPDYDLSLWGIERLHPFDGRKFSRAWRETHRVIGDTLARRTIRPPRPAERHELLAIHTEEYLNKLRSPRYLAQVIELPVLAALPMRLLESRVLKPMRLAVMGTMMAAREALRHGVAVNIAGGYHHASREKGEGFCVYADINIAIETLRRSGELIAGQDKVLIIDLDAHQGNGHERISAGDPDIFIFDIYNRDIFPQDREARARIDRAVPLSSGADDETYIGQLRRHLPAVIRAASGAKIALYIAGTDIYERDLLGGLCVSPEGIRARDRIVLEALIAAEIPVAMLTGGGYSRESYRHIANSLCYIFEKWV
ncbi:MAG: histone deacetylase [Chloroflexi bacterium]|nr:histone deacetylase [Chloroflexota bacterium]